MALISIKEYAQRNGMTHDNVRHKCQRGGYKTAQKIGRDWLIDEKEANVDHRTKSDGRKARASGREAKKGE